LLFSAEWEEAKQALGNELETKIRPKARAMIAWGQPQDECPMQTAQARYGRDNRSGFSARQVRSHSSAIHTLAFMKLSDKHLARNQPTSQ
jgi:hypothetical protein